MRQKILSFYLITVSLECGTFMCLLNNYWKQLSKAMSNFLKPFQSSNITFSTATRGDLYKVLIWLYTFLCVLNPCFFHCAQNTTHILRRWMILLLQSHATQFSSLLTMSRLLRCSFSSQTRNFVIVHFWPLA